MGAVGAFGLPDAAMFTNICISSRHRCGGQPAGRQDVPDNADVAIPSRGAICPLPHLNMVSRWEK
jgi:hypothetical protein